MGFFGRKPFSSADEAMEFLIQKIAEEAELQGCPLNQYEMKALKYASDEPSTGWEIDWDKVRGSDYEGAEFEAQMSALLKAAYKRHKKAGEDVSFYRSASRSIQEQPYWIAAISLRAVPQGFLL